VRRSVPLVLLVLALAGCDGDSGDERAGETTARQEAEAAAAGAAAGCRAPAEPTPEQTEGPFYKEGPPRRSSLIEPGVSGRRLLLAGRVLSTDCRPVAGARVDVWQADGNGAYDNQGYRLRGYQLTGGDGRYRVETVVPADYDGRTAHIHVKVRPPGRDVLTTQLYFPGKARNEEDPIFTPATVLRLRRGSSPWRASFDFVVERG
jgi:protocatechuate 3,4-dioxygenase beta subunit